MALKTIFLRYCPHCRKSTLHILDEEEFEYDDLPHKEIRFWCLECKMVVETQRIMKEGKR